MYKGLKRLFDIIISTIAVIILSPVFLIIAIILKIDSRGPVLFKQKRVGKNKCYFRIYKFRSMYVNAPSEMPTHLLKDPNSMLTRFGKILRKSSLDELPQLFNILKGEMSIVGPRPALWNQYDLIEERDKYGVNDIRPGLTGWAQINGRDELGIVEKSKFDAYYVKNISLSLDLKCFFCTFVRVAKGNGIIEGEVGQKNK